MGYYSNREAFARECVNKSRPQLHCNGQCLLMKKLKQEENKDKQNPERRAENKNEVVLSSHSSFPSLNPPVIPVFSQQYSATSEGKAIKMPRSLFHPPLA